MTKITNFVWNPVDDCIISELDGTGAVQAVYTNEPQQYGGVISQRRGTTTGTYHTDALGSTRFLTDSSGNVSDTYLYDAWGNPVANSGTTVNPFRWVGRYGYYQDESTGLVYVRARMYQPTVARWVSVDPLFPATREGFQYGSNRPTSTIDPTGMLGWNSGQLSIGPCGQFRWPVAFLPGPAERQGWIIQEVTFYFQMHKCGSAVSIRSQLCESGSMRGLSGGTEIYRYWEAWYVTRSGAVAVAGPIQKIGNTWRVKANAPDCDFGIAQDVHDTFGFDGASKTQTQEIRFEEKGKVFFLKGTTIPGEFMTPQGRPRREAPASLSLASTCTKPKSVRFGSPILERSIVRIWNCCCDDKDLGSVTVSMSGDGLIPFG